MKGVKSRDKIYSTGLFMKRLVVSNPAIRDFLSRFRDEKTGTYECNICVETISFFLAGELSNFLLTEEVEVKTPLGEKICSIVKEEVILVPILRAGVAMLSGFQRVLPRSQTGFMWVHRNNEAKAEMDKYKFPSNAEGKTFILLDTMLATAGTLNLSSEVVKRYHPRQILCASILATPFGLDHLSRDIDGAVTAEVSDKLDGNLYVYPGVGDSGDRLFG